MLKMCKHLKSALCLSVCLRKQTLLSWFGELNKYIMYLFIFPISQYYPYIHSCILCEKMTTFPSLLIILISFTTKKTHQEWTNKITWTTFFLFVYFLERGRRTPIFFKSSLITPVISWFISSLLVVWMPPWPLVVFISKSFTSEGGTHEYPHHVDYFT